jgi:hypothetical protein
MSDSSCNSSFGDLDPLANFLLETRALEAECGSPLEREAFLQERVMQLFERHAQEMMDLARKKLSVMNSRDLKSEGSIVNEFFLYATRSPEVALALRHGASTSQSVKRVFLGAFYLALKHRVTDTRRKERADAKHGLSWIENMPKSATEEPLVTNEELLQALDELARIAPRRGEIARMKIMGDPSAPTDDPSFSRLPESQIASLLGISVRLVSAEWSGARSWLTKRLGSQ